MAMHQTQYVRLHRADKDRMPGVPVMPPGGGRPVRFDNDGVALVTKQAAGAFRGHVGYWIEGEEQPGLKQPEGPDGLTYAELKQAAKDAGYKHDGPGFPSADALRAFLCRVQHSGNEVKVIDVPDPETAPELAPVEA
jgi:hypothetical protein